MSIEHLNAAVNCKTFTGNAKLLLMALANRASNGGVKSKFPYGWCFPGIARLMMDIGAKSRDTVIDNLRLLAQSGVIRRNRRMGSSSTTFVDITMLKALAYTDDDEEEFRRKATPKRKEPPPDVGDREWEELLHSDVELFPTNDGGEVPTGNGGTIPTASVGTVPTDNLNNESMHESSVFQLSDSESESADSESEFINVKIYPKGSPVFGLGQDSPSVPPRKRPFYSDAELLVPAKGKPSPVQLNPQDLPARSFCQDSPSDSIHDKETLTPSSAAPLSREPAPDPLEYGDIVYLCSLWWATHPQVEVGDEDVYEWEGHPWGHPRYWTVEQRREAFLNRTFDLDEADEDTAELDSEPEPRPHAEEEAKLKDEKHMFALYREHGRDGIERILRWLPVSDYWFRNPDSKLTSLATLTRKKVWELMSGHCEKYYSKAADSGTESDCDEYVATTFSAAGGDDAANLCFERLNPVDPEDASEEEEMYRLDSIE